MSTIFSYCPFNVCRICSDVPFFLLDVVICVLSPFCLIIVARSLSLLLIFSKNQIGFHWFCCLMFWPWKGPSFMERSLLGVPMSSGQGASSLQAAVHCSGFQLLFLHCIIYFLWVQKQNLFFFPSIFTWFQPKGFCSRLAHCGEIF